MKTLDELYSEVMASNELKKEFCSLKPEQVEGFAAKYGCKATAGEIKAFLTAKTQAAGELSDDEIEQAAGGKSSEYHDVLLTVLSLGTLCSIKAIISVSGDNCGTAIEGEGFLCGDL